MICKKEQYKLLPQTVKYVSAKEMAKAKREEKYEEKGIGMDFGTDDDA